MWGRNWCKETIKIRFAFSCLRTELWTNPSLKVWLNKVCKTLGTTPLHVAQKGLPFLPYLKFLPPFLLGVFFLPSLGSSSAVLTPGPIKARADWGSRESLLLGSWMTIFFLCSHMAKQWERLHSPPKSYPPRCGLGFNSWAGGLGARVCGIVPAR